MLNARDRELLAAIVDSSDDGIVSMTLGGTITSWNRAAERIFGYTAGETVGQSILMLLPADRLAEEEHFLSEIGAGRRVEHFETIRVRKDGAPIQVLVSLSPIRDAAGVIAGASKIVRDISDRVQLERRAEKAAADLDRVLSNLGEGFAALDRDLRYVSVNDAAVRMVGLPREAVIGRTPAELLPREVVAQVQPWIQAALSTGDAVQHEAYFPTYDRWYHQRLYPTADGISLFFTDITARKKAEAALRESRDVLSLAMRGGRMGAWSRDVVTGEVWWSRELEELFGIPPGGFEGTEAGFLAFVHQDDRARVQEAVSLAVASGSDWVVEFRFQHADGGWRWMEVRGRAVYTEDGAPRSLHGIGIDITERKAFEDQLAAARDAADAANRAKDEFMAMLGHELRNPLSPILTALQLMKLRGDVGAERERTVIERQVKHLTRLVDDLLDVSRIARGKVTLTLEVVEIVEVVMRAVEIASPLFEERSQTLSLDVPRTGLPVEGDVARLAQVVSNLLSNAAKYTAHGGTIVVTAGPEHDGVALRVRDPGVGIAPDVLPSIFDLFVQGRQTLDRAHGGLGLGLSIVKNLVERHGGRVAAHSEGLNRGSEFVVWLPRARAMTVEAALEAEPASRAPTPTGAAPRVLVVDDNQDAASLLAEALALRGWDARVAYDGPEALRLAAAFRPQVACLDLGLPVMDGFELAARLRGLPGLGDLRLVAVTGYGQDADRGRTAAAGFHHHLVKPVDLDLLDSLLGGAAPAVEGNAGPKH
jgi:PAS domain S-box-containing protein